MAYEARSPETRRYVVLHHIGTGEDHFDVMFERDGALATWGVPSTDFTVPQTARKKPDHRPAYLDYEGPVSGDRGSVRRVRSGTYRLCESAPDRWVVVLDEVETIAIRLESGDQWKIARIF
jgi:hypothetical protein